MSSIPNLFVVGAAKSGTSSLFHYLDAHPDVFMSRVKEPHYFCHEYLPDPCTGPGDEGFSSNIYRREDDYRQLFAAGEGVPVRGEASVYYLYFPTVAERIYEFNKAAKIIIILRNPVDRAFSAYLHTIRDGRETLSFERALKQESERRKSGYQPLWWYREVGRYSQQVQRYQEVFPPNQIKIFLYEDLVNANKVMAETFAFLDVNPNHSIDTSIKYNVSGVPRSRRVYRFFAESHPFKELLKPFIPTGLRTKLGQAAKNVTLKKPTMRSSTRRVLVDDFRPDVERLQKLINRDLSDWMK